MTAFWNLTWKRFADLTGIWWATALHVWKDVKSQWAERQESFKASNKVKHSETISLVFCGLLAGRDINEIIHKYKNDPVQTNLL